MFRVLALLSVFALVLWSCGPDSRPCSGPHPDFKVVLKLMAGPLPADTVVHVTYAGSGMETFRLSDPNAPHEVVFCRVADENGTPLDASAPGAQGPVGAAGAAGAAGDSGAGADAVASLYCELWTAGFTQLEVTGSGFLPVVYDLTPRGDQCTVDKQLVLDTPDAG